MSNPESAQQVVPVNIVIPVYKNLEVTRRCIESVLASDLPDAATITLIEDASPEQAVREYCQSLAASGRVQLVVNESNLGFVLSANRGFDSQPEADVLLLNSDTEVANDWLARMRDCAYREDRIATVTPFSNNATICSYPSYPVASEPPANWDTASLDRIFSTVNAGRHAEIPTGVGFCLFIKRSCLDQIGGFDEQSFGLGYGEECDFSLRAQAEGWRNVIAADVFVFHEGAVSFSDDSESRKEQAGRVMHSLHPEYDDLVARFIHADPLREFRRGVDERRLALNPADGADLLRESAAREQALRKHAADYRDVLAGERAARKTQAEALGESLEKSAWLDKALREATEKSIWLEQQLREALEKCAWLEQQASLQREELEQQREILSEREQSLAQLAGVSRAQGEEIATLEELLRQNRADFARTDEALAEAQRAVTDLNEEIGQMKRSRSWRYTAWMRGVKGAL